MIDPIPTAPNGMTIAWYQWLSSVYRALRVINGDTITFTVDDGVNPAETWEVTVNLKARTGTATKV